MAITRTPYAPGMVARLLAAARPWLDAPAVQFLGWMPKERVWRLTESGVKHHSEDRSRRCRHGGAGMGTTGADSYRRIDFDVKARRFLAMKNFDFCEACVVFLTATRVIS